MKLRLIAYLALACPFPLWAADLYVNNVTGSNTEDGLSAGNALATVDAAIAKTSPGDTIHLAVTDMEYRQAISIENKSGEPGRPITIDGHGITINGSDPCPKEGWQDAGKGVWRLPKTTTRNILVVDGAIVLEKVMASSLTPGQFSFEYGQFNVPTINFKTPGNFVFADNKIEAVSPSGEITLLDPALWKGGEVKRYVFKGKPRPVRLLVNGAEAPFLAAKDNLQPGEWCNSDGDLLYLPPSGKKPADLDIALAVRECGVQIAGNASHLVIKNFNVKYVWNDAYNIHGATKDISFFNCNARDCFDEGFSAHDDCETLLDGAVYERCDNGVMNVNKSGYSITRNIVVRDSRHKGYGVAILEGSAQHELTNAVLINNPEPLSARYLKAENILIFEESGQNQPSITMVAPVLLKQTTILGGNFKVNFAAGTGDIQLDRCVISAFVGAQAALDITSGQKILLSDVSLSSNLQVAISEGKKSKSTPLAEWISASAGDSGHATVSPPSPAAKDVSPQILPPHGCDATLLKLLSN